MSWHEEKAEKSKKAAGVVVIKHMFTPEQIDDDATVINDLREDLESECKKWGTVKKIMIFDRHHEGVVSVKFAEIEAAHKCIKVMNGRAYDQKYLEAAMWDGHTSYKIEESEGERESRLKKWEQDLENE